jgi:hypothetical protein
VDTTGVVDQRQQRVDDGLEAGHLAVPQQVLEDRVLRLAVQVGQRVGVGGVAALDPLRLGQLELVEQDHLQLLGRTKVERAPDQRVGLLLDVLDRAAQLGLQRDELVGIDGDSHRLHVGQHVQQRQLHLGQ